LFKVTSETFPKWLYFYAIREHLAFFRQIASGEATTMGHIQRHHLTEAKVALPGAKILARADTLMAPLLDRQVKAALESRALGDLRDNLLPKLISGELRVPEAEDMLTGTSI
jgi:type I restriction enzyme S subunit